MKIANSYFWALSERPPPARYLQVRFIAPTFLANKVMPLYLAFVLFIIRFYAQPALLGYDVVSFSAMPLEALVKGVFIDFGLI
jgi:hypothetical protein